MDGFQSTGSINTQPDCGIHCTQPLPVYHLQGIGLDQWDRKTGRYFWQALRYHDLWCHQTIHEGLETHCFCFDLWWTNKKPVNIANWDWRKSIGLSLSVNYRRMGLSAWRLCTFSTYSGPSRALQLSSACGLENKAKFCHEVTLWSKLCINETLEKFFSCMKWTFKCFIIAARTS